VLRPAAITLALLLGLAGCGRDQPGDQRQGRAANQAAPAGTDQALTPMAERVAVIGLLNKRNGIVRNFTLRPGQSVRLKDATVRLLACETTAPWESEKLTGAFVQLDVQGSDNRWRRAFSGWLYTESPSLNVVQHPVYDVWPKSCAMTFPAGPPAPAAPAPSSSRSSAERSPTEDAAPSEEPAVEPAPAPEAPPPSAVDSNAT
jgi:hypothetical protein